MSSFFDTPCIIKKRWYINLHFNTSLYISMFTAHFLNKKPFRCIFNDPRSFFQALRHPTQDVQSLACDTVWYISKTCSDINPSFFKPIMLELLTLSKEKNTAIKCSSEIAICSVVKVKENDAGYQVRKISKNILPHEQILESLHY